MARTPPTLHLKPGKEKSLLRRHPWIYANAIDRASGGPASGDTVRVLGADGRFLAWAAFSPTSALRARAWSFTEAEQPDAAFIAARVAAAVARREGLQAQTEAIRLVFGEADALPGLVVDRYRDQLVVQFLAAGVEHWREVIVAALREVTGCEAVYERSDAAAREREGLVAREGVLHGEVPVPVAVCPPARAAVSVNVSPLSKGLSLMILVRTRKAPVGSPAATVTPAASLVGTAKLAPAV